MSQDRRHTVEDERKLRFYQMPKDLFGNSNYKGTGAKDKGLSIGAKAMYSILRDRQDLSIENNWVDSEGFIYLVFDIEKLAELIEMDRKTVMAYKKELVKYGLLIDKRIGQGKANRLYVLKPIPNNKTTQTLDITEKSKKRTSKSGKNGLQEVQKMDTNDTDFNEKEEEEERKEKSEPFLELSSDFLQEKGFGKTHTQQILKKIKEKNIRFSLEEMEQALNLCLNELNRNSVRYMGSLFEKNLEVIQAELETKRNIEHIQSQTINDITYEPYNWLEN